jgi:hypothetical protein
MRRCKPTAAGDPATQALSKLSKCREPLVAKWAAALLARGDREGRRTAQPRQKHAATK